MFPLASSQPTTITVDLKEIRKIVELMDQHELSYFHLKEEGVDLKMKKGADIVQVAQAAMPAAPASAPAAQAAPAGGEAPADAPAGNAITAPMVGTYYSASSPDAAAFVKVGDTISEGQTICIIEAMKVMNEIQSEIAGTVVECLVANGTSVEFGQPLFRVKVS